MQKVTKVKEHASLKTKVPKELFNFELFITEKICNNKV